MAQDNFEDYLKVRAKEIDDEIHMYLAQESSDRYVQKLLGRSGYKYDHEAITKAFLDPAWYLVGLGGKRWRPVLMLLMLEALGKDPKHYIEFSIVPEVIHNATLVHDDIEDNSPVRRGSPAVHVKFPIDVAINLGNLLYYFPVVALLDSKKLSTEEKNRFLSVYVREMLRVSIGQATDIAWHDNLVDPARITEDNYLEMVYDKTGVLASMACQLAGVLAGVENGKLKALGRFGATVGVAFQLQDDVLNLLPSGVSKTKGGVGDDISEGKITILVIYALRHLKKDESKRLLEILRMKTKDQKLKDEAIAFIRSSGAIEYSMNLQKKIVNEAWEGIDKILKDSEAKRRIKQLADFLVERSV